MRAQGAAYVAFALARPARFDLMWRAARIDLADPEYVAASRRAFRTLEAAVIGVPPDDVPERLPTAADTRAVACWSLVHGFARLALDGALGADAETAADALLARVLETVRA
jgi:hypothetical protein